MNGSAKRSDSASEPQVASLVASQEHRVSQLAARAAAEQEQVRMSRWLSFVVSHRLGVFGRSLMLSPPAGGCGCPREGRRGRGRGRASPRRREGGHGRSRHSHAPPVRFIRDPYKIAYKPSRQGRENDWATRGDRPQRRSAGARSSVSARRSSSSKLARCYTIRGRVLRAPCERVPYIILALMV